MHAHQVGPSIAFLGTAFLMCWAIPRLFGPRGGVRMWHCRSVSVVCVPSLSVVQPLDCWSDPMALVALTLWGSGASSEQSGPPKQAIFSDFWAILGRFSAIFEG